MFLLFFRALDRINSSSFIFDFVFLAVVNFGNNAEKAFLVAIVSVPFGHEGHPPTKSKFILSITAGRGFIL